MNGAVGGYGAIPSPATAYPLRMFKSDAVLFWEADESGGGAKTSRLTTCAARGSPSSNALGGAR